MQPVPPTISDAQRINLSWLIQLRWGAVGGQVVTILAVARVMGLSLPLASLFSLILVEVVTNLAATALLRRAAPSTPPIIVREWWLTLLMSVDVLILTGLLYLTGGPFNPFSFLYLVQIALAAVILRARSTWMLLGLSGLCSGVLFMDHRPLHLGASHAEHMNIHLQGMWVAFVVAAAFIVYFLMRVTRALSDREAELSAARHLAARQERLASLATMAAGAAHELSTPLSTIALVAKELELELLGSRKGSPLDDVRLIRSQVDRCRAILDRMAVDAGESAGEDIVEVPIGEVLRSSLLDLEAQPAIRVELDESARTRSLRLPPRALAQAIHGLVKNAQDASGNGVPVVVRASVQDGHLRLEVRDQGGGMPAEILARAGEPFFTTKAPGRGMGLGLFLSRAVAERLGGELRLESKLGLGTAAVLDLPLPEPR